MNDQPDDQNRENDPQPVAYDVDGRPLYHHPPVYDSQQNMAETPPVIDQSEGARPQPQNETAITEKADDSHQYVHFRRALSPEKSEIPEDIKKKHAESVEMYPNLNLSEGEYVLRTFSRHPIGMIAPVVVGLFMILLVGALLISLPLLTDSVGLDPSAYGLVFIVGLMLMILFALGAYISVWVYTNNRFYLTNESVIQEIQTSLFAKHEQTVSLGNVEDASYQQNGIVSHMFNYGSIRLSTEGDETTYRFPYTANPKDQIAVLNNAVEAFKNGRPVEER